MKRRVFVKSLAGVAALPVGLRLLRTSGQEATPDETAGIPPVLWRLVSIDTDDSSQTPSDPRLFTVQFFADGNVGLKADCNVGSGRYTLDGETFAVTDIISTLAFCGDDSLDQDFLAALQAATSWSISSDPGDILSLHLDQDGGRMQFEPALQGVVWEWQEFLGGDGGTIVPDAPERYQIEFFDDLRVQVKADCNTGRGSATVNGSEIDLTVAMTRKQCAEDSYFDDYFRILDEAVEYVIQNGMLYLNLPMDSGGGRFRAIAPDFGDAATPVA
jgi:heat shock protein HslJ